MHEGYPGNAVTVRLSWVCPVCGGPRGEPYDTISYDGSRRLGVSGWRNDCGHVDYYSNCRDEAVSNGLNTPNNACSGLAETSAEIDPESPLVNPAYAVPGEPIANR